MMTVMLLEARWLFTRVGLSAAIASSHPLPSNPMSQKQRARLIPVSYLQWPRPAQSSRPDTGHSNGQPYLGVGGVS